MGHLANPISIRLNISRVWQSNFSFFNKKIYFYLLNENLELLNILNLLVTGKYSRYFINKGFIIFKYNIVRFLNKNIIYLFVYDSFFNDIILFIRKNINFIANKNKYFKKSKLKKTNNNLLKSGKYLKTKHYFQDKVKQTKKLYFTRHRKYISKKIKNLIQNLKIKKFYSIKLNISKKKKNIFDIYLNKIKKVKIKKVKIKKVKFTKIEKKINFIFRTILVESSFFFKALKKKTFLKKKKVYLYKLKKKSYFNLRFNYNKKLKKTKKLLKIKNNNYKKYFIRKYFNYIKSHENYHF